MDVAPLDTILYVLPLGEELINTKFIIFGSKSRMNRLPTLPVCIDGVEIERVEVFKYLGIFLHSHLNFEHHINVMHQKASRKLSALRKTREFVDQSTALMLYKSLVLPHFDYCDTVYMTASATHLNKLQLLQNSACRTILLAEARTSTDYMHNELDLLRLNERQKLPL